MGFVGEDRSNLGLHTDCHASGVQCASFGLSLPASIVRRPKTTRRASPRACGRSRDHAYGRALQALDALTRQALQDELIRVWAAYKKTVVFVTHDIDDAVYLADRVVALGGKPGEVKASLLIDAPRPRERHHLALQTRAMRVKQELVEEAIGRDNWVI